MTTTECDVARIAAFDHTTAMRLAATEYGRLLALLRELEPHEWELPTDCAAWDVRTLVAHVVGMAEGMASPVEFARVGWAAWRSHASFVDGMTEKQVRDRRKCAPEQLIARFGQAIPGAVRRRTRFPAPLRSVPLRFASPNGDKLRWNFGYLYDVIVTRDNWMHRIDLTRATGREMEMSAEHDGVIVADVVREWAAAHGQPFRLALEGAAGGLFHGGSDGEGVGPIAATQFCRILSGRDPGHGLLATEVPF